MGEAINVRFRLPQSDVGPLQLPASSTVADVKERLLAAWPKEGPLSSESPSAPADIKLILSGKFLADAETLESLKPHMGELKPDTLVTVHVVVRTAAVTKTAGKGADKDEASGCSCSIM